jgi:preprotein translocase subunit Sss1
MLRDVLEELKRWSRGKVKVSQANLMKSLNVISCTSGIWRKQIEEWRKLARNPRKPSRKELLTYLETLVAFCPYYRADDPRVTAHIDKCYHSALEKYRDIPYDELHGFLTELKMAEAYGQLSCGFSPKTKNI